MKIYSREKKKWVDEEEVTKKLSKRKLCKGNRPHNYVLTLPSYVKTIGNVCDIGIEEYYKSEQRQKEFSIKESELLKGFGIIINSFNRFGTTQYLECSVCGKKDYIY